jgi:predicted porin
MNKKLLIAAVGAALVAGPMLAQAETTVYGHFHESLDSYDNGGSGVGASDTTNGMLNSNSSRFGIKGNEDLGGGLKAIYQVESPAFAADDGSGGFGGTLRNTYVGFADSMWGSVKFGRHDAPVKNLSRKVDAFNEEIGDMRTVVGYQAFDNRVSNMVRYDSPSFGGFQAALQYGASEVNTTSSTTSGSVTWGQGPIWLGLGYEVHKTHDDADKDESDMRLVGRWYIIPDLYVGALYDSISNVDNVDNVDGKAWSVFAGFKMANNLFKFQYSKADSPDTTDNLGASLWAIGVDHMFSKTTKVYLDYAKADNEDLQNVNVSSGYAGHGTSAVPAVAEGKSPSAVSLGMIVNF